MVSSMNEKKYQEFFEQMGIKVDPLPQNYNPDEYGKKLMSAYISKKTISYSANTNYTPDIERKKYIN